MSNYDFFFDYLLEYDDWDMAMEAATGIERINSYNLKNAFYDTVATNLSKPANEKALFMHIAKFRDRNITALSSPYIEKIIPFNTRGEDAKVVYRACGIDEDELAEVLKKTLKEVKLDRAGPSGGDAANIIPIRVALIMAMSHYMDQPEKFRAVYLYYAYSFYFSVYTTFFISESNINMDCMKFTVNNMTNKFDLKKCGSLEGMLDDTMAVACTTYKTNLKECGDMDIINLINAFKTRVAHKMRSIRGEYQKNYDKGNRYFEAIERNDEGDFLVDRESHIALVDTLAGQYTMQFFQERVNTQVVSTVAKLCTVADNELRTCISLLHDENNAREVREFYNCLFQLFFEEYPKATKSDVNSNKFFVAGDSIYKKGNSNDKNIIRIKELSHVWLSRGSNTYRSSTRPDTLNRYRKAIYLYFVLVVSTKR